jgi:hypothetical protein
MSRRASASNPASTVFEYLSADFQEAARMRPTRYGVAAREKGEYVRPDTVSGQVLRNRSMSSDESLMITPVQGESAAAARRRNGSRAGTTRADRDISLDGARAKCYNIPMGGPGFGYGSQRSRSRVFSRYLRPAHSRAASEVRTFSSRLLDLGTPSTSPCLQSTCRHRTHYSKLQLVSLVAEARRLRHLHAEGSPAVRHGGVR